MLQAEERRRNGTNGTAAVLGLTLLPLRVACPRVVVRV